MLNKFGKFQSKILNWIFQDKWSHIIGMIVIITVISIIMAFSASGTLVGLM